MDIGFKFHLSTLKTKGCLGLRIKKKKKNYHKKKFICLKYCRRVNIYIYIYIYLFLKIKLSIHRISNTPVFEGLNFELYR